METKRAIPSQKTFAETEIPFETFMNSIPKGFRADRAEGVTARIQFLFEDKEAWLLRIHDQQCDIEKIQIDRRDMTVKTDSGTWQDIMLSKIDAMQAMMTGKVDIDTEDMELLMKFARMFKFTPEIFQGAS